MLPGMLPGMMAPGMMPGVMPGMLPLGLMSGMGSMPSMVPGVVSPTMTLLSGMNQGLVGSSAVPATAAPATAAAAPASAAQPQPAAAAKAAGRAEEPKEALPVDPEVKELCEHFGIADSCAARLNEEIAKRRDSKDADLARLWELLEDVGSPTCLLELKIEEMQAGEFVGKVTSSREVEALARNFGLSAEATSKLNEMVARRATRKGEDLVRMENVLEHSKAPDATALHLAGRVLAGELQALPDLGEAEDVMRKFKLDKDAKCKLVEIVLARLDDSSRVLGRLEVYLEMSRQPSSAALEALAGRLLAGGDVPDEPREEAVDRERDRMDRERDRRRQRSRSRGRRSPRGHRSPRSRGRR